MSSFVITCLDLILLDWSPFLYSYGRLKTCPVLYTCLDLFFWTGTLFCIAIHCGYFFGLLFCMPLLFLSCFTMKTWFLIIKIYICLKTKPWIEVSGILVFSFFFFFFFFFFCKDDSAITNNLIVTVESFEVTSGLKINWEKSVINEIHLEEFRLVTHGNCLHGKISALVYTHTQNKQTKLTMDLLSLSKDSFAKKALTESSLVSCTHILCSELAT